MTWTGTYTDIAVVVVLLIAFIVGVSKGFMKQLSSLIGGLVAFIGAIAITAVVSGSLKETEFFQSFIGTTTGWFANSEFFGSEAASSIATKIAELFKDMTFETPADLFGYLTATAIAYFVIWLVVYIVLKFLIKGIKALMLKIVHLPVLKTVDKVFGAIWGVFMAYVILIGIVLTAVEIVVYQFVPEFWEPVAQIIQDSKLLSWAHGTNIIGQLIAGWVGMPLPKLTAATALAL